MSSTSTQDTTARDLAQLHEEYLRKMDSALDHDLQGLAAELSADYASEAGLPAPVVRRPAGLRRRTTDLLRRLDRHTLKAYNPSWPYRAHQPRDER